MKRRGVLRVPRRRGPGPTPGPAPLILLCLLAIPACDSGSQATDPPPPNGDDPPTFDEDGTWSEVSPLPVPVYLAAGAAYRDRIYVAGGFTADGDPTAAVQRFDPETGAWTRLADLPEPIAESGLAVHRDTLFLLGGNAGPESSLVPRAAVLRYDADADVWSEHSVLPENRQEHGSASVGDRLVVFGGGSFEPPPGDSIAVYGADGSWRRGPPPPRASGRVTTFGRVGESVLVLETITSASLDVFDGGTETWSSLPSTPVTEFPRFGTAWKGRLHVFSYNGPETFHRAFDPVDETWVTLPPMDEPLRDAVAVALGERLYVVGGRGRGATPEEVVSRVEAFSRP